MDLAAIKTGFDGFIGWKQNDDASGLQLVDLLTSSSGMFYNDIHPILTIENIASVSPDYKKLFPVVGDQNTNFTAWLKGKTENGIIETINDWNSSKRVFGTGVNLLHSKRLFNTASSISNTTTVISGLYGIELRPRKSKSIILRIRKIALQFSNDDTINIKVFQSGKPDPLYTLDVDYDQNGDAGVQFEDVDWKLKANNNYYVVFDGGVISVSPINGIYDYSYVDNGRWSFPTGRYFQATSFNNPNGTLTNIGDIKDNQYTHATNYGINLDITVECDLSDFIIEQRQLFLEAVRLKVGLNLMREIAFNPNSRINRNEANATKREIINEIDGDTQGNNSMSVFGRYRHALKNIAFDDSQIDAVCLPCLDEGVEFSEIGSINRYNANGNHYGY